ncbi:MAG: MFS transporter [Chitinophagaceae bacterium]
MIQSTARAYRNAYSGLSKETWLLSFIMLVNRSGTMVLPFMTLYLTRPAMGYTVGQAGIVLGLFGLGAFSGAWLGGRLTDRIGFYPVQLMTLTGGGILFMLLGQMKTYPLICIFTYLLSFVNEAFRPANSTAIASYSKEENRTRSYALNRLAINIGWAVGSGLGGFLAGINYELLFWVDGCTNLFAAGLLWILLKPVSFKPARHDAEPSVVAVPAYRDKGFMYFILITVLFAACFFQLFTNLPVYFKEQVHLTEAFIGAIMASNGIMIGILEMIIVYKLEGKRNNLVYIAAGVFITGLSFIMLNIPGIGPLLCFLMICTITFGEILALPFMNTYWIRRARPDNRGQYAALYTMAWSAAQTLGPMGGAQLVQQAGFRALWWTTGGLCIITAFFFHRLHRHIR